MKQKYTADYIDEITEEATMNDLIANKEKFKSWFVMYCINKNIAICDYSEAKYKNT